MESFRNIYYQAAEKMLFVIFHKIKILFNPFFFPVVLYKNRNLLSQLIRRNIEARYRGSMLGLIWSFALPLLMLAIYTFVFSVIFKAKFGDIPNDNKLAFALVMFSGMAIFNIFSESILTSCVIITGNPNYVKKVIFPLEILPVSQVLSSLILSMPWFLLLFVGTGFIGVPFTLSWTMLFLPLTIIPLLLFTSGVAFFAASLSVYIRDLQYLVGVIMQILFFITPIFYPISGVPEKYRFILRLNPLSPIVEQTRELFLYGHHPDYFVCLFSLLIGFLCFQLGGFWFVKTKKGFADVL